MLKTAPRLFADLEDGERSDVAERILELHAATKAASTSKLSVIPNRAGSITFYTTEGPTRPTAEILIDELSKSVSADKLDELRATLGDITKDITTDSPLSGGLVGYDLEAPAKLLAPVDTPFRNRISRTKGIGLARHYKRITGISGSLGGPDAIRPGITESTLNDFNGNNSTFQLNRGQTIVYQGDEKDARYVQFSLSDSHTWAAEFAGVGFQDINELSNLGLLLASMNSEEKLILFGRGATSIGYTGNIADVATPTLTVRDAVAGETALPNHDDDYYVTVVASGGWGLTATTAVQTAASVRVNSATKVVDVTVTDVTGALEYYVFAAKVDHSASAPSTAATHLQGRTGYNVFTVQGVIATSGPAANAFATNNTSSAAEYDGIFTVTTAEGGYLVRLNTSFNLDAPGQEIQDAFSAMYNKNKANPDEVWLNPLDLSDLARAVRLSTGFKFEIGQSEVSTVTLGVVAKTIINSITGKVVPLKIHTAIPQGNILIKTWVLPFANTEISETTVAVNVTDYTAIDWPTIDFNKSKSSYWFGTVVHYAPEWDGLVQGVKPLPRS